MNRYHRVLVVLTLTLAVAVCGIPPVLRWWQARPRDSGKGRLFKESLIRVVDNAREIRITEHSDRSDFADGNEPVENPPAFEYRSRILTISEREVLLNCLREMDPRQVESPYFCGFSPHHRFEWIGSEAPPMEVCFRCGDVSWDGSSARPPDALIPILERFLDSAGFPPKRDWQAIAMDRLRQSR